MATIDIGRVVLYAESSTVVIARVQFFGVAVTANVQAVAGDNQMDIEPWAVVTLNGSDSSSDNLPLTYAWAQTGGTSVTLSSSTAQQPTFEGPAVISGDVVSFQLTVTDAIDFTSSDSVDITILPPTERAAIGGIEVPLRIRTD